MNTPQRARTGASISKVAQSTIFTVFALAAMVLGSLVGPLASANAADGCADVEVVFARGTNEAPGVSAPPGRRSSTRSAPTCPARRSTCTE